MRLASTLPLPRVVRWPTLHNMPMDALKSALVGQYRATLAMLRQQIEVCPNDVWVGGTHPRNFWRIVYHALFYAHLYAMQREEDFVPWTQHREGATSLWDDDVPPPVVIEPYSQTELLSYLDHIYENIEPWVDRLDLTTPDPGFYWYKIPKLDHQILSIRHVNGHVGQLSELLMAHEIDTDWVSKK